MPKSSLVEDDVESVKTVENQPECRVSNSRVFATELEKQLRKTNDPYWRRSSFREPAALFAALVSGTLLGLSSPGIEQWYLAWVGLVPLFLLIFQSKSILQSTIRGTFFAFAFNLVYLNWLLGSHPSLWKDASAWQAMAILIFDWGMFAGRLTLVTAVFSALSKALPLSGSISPSTLVKQRRLPALLVIPALWVLVHKVGNLPDLSGVSWSMLEYTQYRQLPFIQIAAWVGGVGIQFMIVMVNIGLAIFVATKYIPALQLAAVSLREAVGQSITVIAICLGVTAFGSWSIANCKFEPDVHVSVVQTNIPFSEQIKTSIQDKLFQAGSLAANSAPGLCVFTEGAMPISLKKHPNIVNSLKQFAINLKVDTVIGALDGTRGARFNSVYAISRDGTLSEDVYHKRFLVPFFEYVPAIIKILPKPVRTLISRSSDDLLAGTKPTVFSVQSGRIAPLLCFEAIDPDLVGRSVRNGAELLIDLSDLSAHRSSVLGEQMLSFSVLRAIENKKYFVFAGNTGPSAIIDPVGRIVCQSPYDQRNLFEGEIEMLSEDTVFSVLNK